MTNKEFSTRLTDMVKMAISKMGDDDAALLSIDAYVKENLDKIYDEYDMKNVHSCYDFILENIYYEVRDDIRRRMRNR